MYECVMHQVLPLVGECSGKFLLVLDGRIDEDRLGRAVRLSLEAEPILGCRFVDRKRRPLWERREDLDGIPLCEVVSCADGRPHIARFLATPIDTTRDPLVKIMVVRAASDTVCVKVPHEVADGPSMKDYFHLLFRLYHRLKDDPGYRPQPNPIGVRSLGEAFRRFSLWTRLRAIRKPKVMRVRGRGRWIFPPYGGDDQRHRCVYLLMKLPSGRAKLLEEYGLRRRAPVTAVLLAAFCLALRSIARPVNENAVAIGTTIDFRRLVAVERRSSTPGNVSAPVGLTAGVDGNWSFDELLKGLSAQLRQFAANPFRFRGGLDLALDLVERTVGVAVMRPFLRRMVNRASQRLRRSQRPLNCALINLGKLIPEYGEEAAAVVEAHFLGMAFYIGGIQISVSEFRESMTISVGFSNRFIEEQVLRRLLEELDRSLPCQVGTPAEIVSIKED
jgi:NRPS condensation-like uncharacterized protein